MDTQPGAPRPDHEPQTWVIERDDFGRLFDVLHARGYTTVGPTARDGAVVYDELSGAGELPAGWTDVQDAAQYRLERRDDGALFGYVIGPQSWKKFLFPPRRTLWRATRNEHGFDMEGGGDAPPKLALIGVRACELAAIAIQDKVLTAGQHADPDYRRRREDLFVVAVNCTKAGGTCFCASMNTGPKVSDGYDLAATEVIEGARHYFVVSAGSDAGADVLKDIPHRLATDEEKAAAYLLEAQAVIGMGRKLDTHGLKDVLLMAASHPHWDTVAERCLGCANCTMVCPTCFCTTVEDIVDITGQHAERRRRWDSCFNLEFSYIHGGAMRTSTAARYRQWMSHKLATWHEQFGSSGCVGCGRCITWCPVGIDITAEANALRGAVTRRGK